MNRVCIVHTNVRAIVPRVAQARTQVTIVTTTKEEKRERERKRAEHERNMRRYCGDMNCRLAQEERKIELAKEARLQAAKMIEEARQKRARERETNGKTKKIKRVPQRMVAVSEKTATRERRRVHRAAEKAAKMANAARARALAAKKRAEKAAKKRKINVVITNQKRIAELKEKAKKMIAKKKEKVALLRMKKKAARERLARRKAMARTKTAKRRAVIKERRDKLSSSGPVTAKNLFFHQNKGKGMRMAQLSELYESLNESEKEALKAQAKENLAERKVIRQSLKRPASKYAVFTKKNFPAAYEAALKQTSDKKQAFKIATKHIARMYKNEQGKETFRVEA